MIVGMKFWYANGFKAVLPLAGRDRADAEAALRRLPKPTLQVIMIYTDEFSTVTCCPCQITFPFVAGVRCPKCGRAPCDSAIRMRRIVSGNDHYFVQWDTVPPEPLHDWLVGQTDKDSDLERYPDAIRFTGGFVNDTAHKAFLANAMADMDVRELGLTPLEGSSDV